MPARLFLSSGDMIADRRFEFARDLQLKGDLVAAADLLLQATELAPNFTSAWFTLGELREQLGQRDAAIAAFRRACAADPEDRHGASLRLMRLGAAAVASMPKAYVQVLFDQYAPRFEASLVGDLGYRGPALLFRAVLSVRAGARKPAFFKRAIDLGCGTGLAATAFAREVDRFIGIDLSPRMIERARATGLYAELEVADMVEGLRGKSDASADLILAADAMVYVADLAPVLGEAARVLAPGGLLAFTVETHPADGVRIGEGLRYAHGEAYVRAQLASRRSHFGALRGSLGPQRGRHPGRPALSWSRPKREFAEATMTWRCEIRNSHLPIPRECRSIPAPGRNKTMNNKQTRRQFGATALATILASGISAPYVRAAEKKYDPGASDTEIKLGQTIPHSGPGSLYGVLGRVGEAYFQITERERRHQRPQDQLPHLG